MQGYIASGIQTVLLTIKGILKMENKIRGISRNKVRRIADFHKTVNGRFCGNQRIEKK